ncbi:hypothetical protein PR202_ga20776 [Eleusine coracana subsp. coracana]|uniref:Sugar phosphate transporter domain-containing protein n=1 Tax=Eleusine coracana subsp. coracana TaxID=191504 RepID=A0AAV5CYT4_ELECO|nr:hypothetical protein PR202_ga20776 [Eleusine coracana subsp. coracana]
MAAADLVITTSVLVHGQDLAGHKEMCEDTGSGHRVSASGGGWEVGLCRHFADAPTRGHDPCLCAKLLPLALIHVMGNAFTNMSLDRVAVSFTHTIKAM